MQPDVVIVGAGAAGVGAGRALQARGVSFVILEAAERIGGRTFTDATSLAAPWDQGAQWFHCADVNPLRPEADRLGLAYEGSDWSDETAIWQAGRWLSPEARAEADGVIDHALGAIYREAAAGRESSLDAVLPKAGPWAAITRNIARLMSSAEPEAVSVCGYAEYADTEVNLIVTGGYGRLIARLAECLPIRLGQPVTRIVQLGHGVRVEGPGGVIEAKAAIVTASTNVLNAGGIRFDAPDVAAMLELMQDVPCGFYEKVALTLDVLPEDLGAARFAWADPGDGALSMGVQVPPGAVPMLIAHLGGDEARDLGRAGAAALQDHVLARLALVFGSGIAARVTGVAVTGWGANPFVRGAYSHVRPGIWQRRRQMIAAETGDIRFAGEAFSLPWHATAHGAWQTGLDVAAAVADRLGHPARG